MYEEENLSEGNPESSSILARLFGDDGNIDSDVPEDLSSDRRKVEAKIISSAVHENINHKVSVTEAKFINDEGVPYYARDKRADNEDIYGSEAEESEDEINKIFAGGPKIKKKKKERRREETLKTEVVEFLSKMEVAAEQDYIAYSLKKPAIHKLKMLQEVEVKLKQIELQELFLKNGLLSIICMWMNLMPDGNLPNINLRSSLIRLIAALPIETDDFDRKDELKKSDLAKILLFLATLNEETSNNRIICKKLIEKWSRPVYELSAQYKYVHTSGQIYDAYDSGDDDLPMRKPRRSSKILESVEDVTNSTHLGPKYGEKGYRHHAEIPDISIPEYIKRPRLQMDPTEVKSRGQSNEQRRIRQLVSKVSGLKKRTVVLLEFCVCVCVWKLIRV